MIVSTVYIVESEKINNYDRNKGGAYEKRETIPRV